MQEEEKHWRIDDWGVPSKQNIGCIIYTTNGILKGADDEHIIVFNRETAELIVKAMNAYLNGFNDVASQMQAEIENKHLKKLCADQYYEIKELKYELQHANNLKILQIEKNKYIELLKAERAELKKLLEEAYKHVSYNASNNLNDRIKEALKLP